MLGWLRRRHPLEGRIREIREVASSPLDYREPDTGDDALVGLMKLRIEPAVQKLANHGFTSLGDLVMDHHGQPLGIMRSYVDGATTCVHVIVTMEQPLPAVPLLQSYARDAHWLTLFGGESLPWLAVPPHSHRQRADAALRFQSILDRHRKFARAEGLIRIATRDDLVRVLVADRALTIAWRDAQPPDQLLEADLRELLGTQFERQGPRLMRRLRADLPRARVHRRS